MIQRNTYVVPGYDCSAHCTHTSYGEHGIACDNWIYTVKDGDRRIALAMEIFTPNFPDTVPRSNRNAFSPRSIVWHYAWPTSREEVLSEPNDCDLLGGKCYSGNSTTFYEREVFERIFVVPKDTHDITQPESFWLGLEAELARRAAQLEAARIDDGDLKWKVCTCCKGERVVPL